MEDDSARGTVAGLGGGGASRPAEGGRIGRYRLGRLLGEGGMGVVYEAEQESPRRTVALKLIRHGFATPAVLRRFEHESETLGRLRHPGIAQVYEAGRADPDQESRGEGAPFFAMELIRGVPLLRFASDQHLGIRERLELAARIADAVQHAHQHGVIHRDLKPANILVDEHGQPKVLDFGIARVLGDASGPITTLAGQLVGTVPYMSPEQAAGTPGAADTRADVYALGVILFELLTGRLPYDVSTATLHEALRLIREQEPVRPASIDRRLRGDIETILLRALEKDRERRYPSAAEFAADIRRFLRREPIMARPSTPAYQLRRLAARHKVVVIGAGAVLAALVAGTIVSWAFAMDANHRRAEAEQQTRIAREVNSFLNDDLLASINPERGNPHDVTVHAALDEAAQRIDGRFPGIPLVEAEVRLTLGQSYTSLGDFAAGEPHLLRALEILLLQVGPDDERALTARNRLGNLYRGWSRYAQAEPYYRDTLDGRLRVLGERHPLTLTSMSNLAGMLRELGRIDEATPLLERAWAIAAEVLEPDNADRSDVANNLAGLYKDLGRYAEARTIYEDLLKIERRLEGPDHPATLRAMSNLAIVYTRTGEYARAEPLYRAALEAQERVLTERHPQVLASMTNLAKLCARLERYEEAEALYTRALALSREALGDTHRGTLITMIGLAAVYLQTGNPAQAEPLLAEALGSARESLGDAHAVTLGAGAELADLLIAQGRGAEALEVIDAAIAGTRQAPAPAELTLARLLIARGAALGQLGRPGDAETALTEAEAILARSADDAAGDAPRLRQSLARMRHAGSPLRTSPPVPPR